MYFYDCLRLRIVSAEPEKVMNKLYSTGAELSEVTMLDSLTYELNIERAAFISIKRMLDAIGASYRIVYRKGPLSTFRNIYIRPILLIGSVLFILFSLLMQDRIFFVRITGNHVIPKEEILLQAENCGIYFGVKASELRSEELKNQLLSALPQLNWLGITIKGTIATIHVSEQSQKPHEESDLNRYCNITASMCGVITEMTVYKGNPLVQTGQSVNTGDLLVTGSSSSDHILRLENAKAEIFAFTLRDLEFQSPTIALIRKEFQCEHICYQLRVGKNVIKLCNHSGIPGATCVKMYEEQYWELPGGFTLPVSVIKTTQRFYSSTNYDTTVELSNWLPKYARSYVNSQMVAGEILEETFRWQKSGNLCILTGKFACHEMISKVEHEEIIGSHAKDY